MRQISSGMEVFLRRLGIVYGVHLEGVKGEKGIRIVLECIPFPSTLDRIQSKLQGIVKKIPARPEPVIPRVPQVGEKA